MNEQAAGILPLSRTSGRTLWNQRSYEATRPAKWGLWGGGAEEGESPVETALREFEEESGYGGQIELLPLHTHISDGVKYYAFVGLVPDEFQPVLNWESLGYLWMEPHELFNIFGDLHPGAQKLLRETYNQLEPLCRR